MRSDGVVVPPPLLDHDAGLPEGVEHLIVEKFVRSFALKLLQ